MRDNAKCAGSGCTLRDSCDRFVRPAVDRQECVEPRAFFRRSQGARSTSEMICFDYVSMPVEPHGGAREEGDAC